MVAMIKGGHIQTKEAFLFGRFETMMKPAFGSGIISSFFTFFDGKDFQKNWNEIDFEFLGKNTNQVDTNVIRTINNYADKNLNTAKHVLNKRSTDVFWKLCIDWTPDKVVWKVNDKIIRTLFVSLKLPQKIMLNIWKSDSVLWAGNFDKDLLPQEAEYKYIRYTSINGNVIWQDDFEKIDPSRWQIADWPIEGTQMVKENVFIKSNNLILKLHE